jgi:hypothetical protein
MPEGDIELIISANRNLDLAARELTSAAAKTRESGAVSVQLIRVQDMERPRH